jgi:hypothetical protein
LGAWGCSGDDDDTGSGGGAADGGGGSGAGNDPGSGTSGSGARAGSGSGSGTSGTGSGTSGSGSGTNGGSGTSGLPGTLADGGLITPSGDLLLCGGENCACSDGIDNDNDGVMDGFDVECTGPFDEDEGSFATGISGDNVDPKWQDCFFDGNSGAGNDGCRYHTDCLTGDKDQDDPDCTVTQMCLEFCMARTPPGCDCFGCCTIPSDDGPVDVFIASGCDSNDISSCTSCVKSDSCDNECGECELCTGVTVNDLPDSCFEKFPPGETGGTGGAGGTTGTSGAGGTTGTSGAGGTTGTSGAGGTTGTGGTGEEPPPVYVCDDNARLCRSQDECPPGYYCQLGCCKVIAPE